MERKYHTYSLPLLLSLFQLELPFGQPSASALSLPSLFYRFALGILSS